MEANVSVPAKVWYLANCKLKNNHHGHNAYLNTITVSLAGSLCTFGCQDSKTSLWNLHDSNDLHTLYPAYVALISYELIFFPVMTFSSRLSSLCMSSSKKLADSVSSSYPAANASSSSSMLGFFVGDETKLVFLYPLRWRSGLLGLLMIL